MNFSARRDGNDEGLSQKEMFTSSASPPPSAGPTRSRFRCTGTQLSVFSPDPAAKVVETAALADLIVLFWRADTPGLDEELQICATAANRLKTVAVVPSTPTEIYLSQVVKTFPRVVSLDEMPPFVALHPEFTP